MMKKEILLFIPILLLGFSKSIQSQNNEEINNLAEKAEKALENGISYIQTLAIEGGYVYHYTLDGKEKWGEGKTDDRTIEVQPPGTPAVGMSFLKAFKVTGNEEYLKAAENAANALIKGQNDLGGWEHKIYFDRPKGNKVSFDDNQTQSAISFLMALDQEIDSPELTRAVNKALGLMINSQLDNGGWPHQYPWQGNYHDYATFNDHGINDCIRVMLEANEYYDREDIRNCLQNVGRFMMISQLPPPQPGWAQQYNEYLQPAWARSFEPPAVCPSASLYNINSLLDLYLFTKSGSYLEPIPDALRWIKASQLPNGKWGRFLEIGTNKPLYYDRGRIRVDSMHQLSLERRTGYGYENDLSDLLNQTEQRYLEVIGKRDKAAEPTPTEKINKLLPFVEDIISNQDEMGRWVVRNDRFRKGTPGYEWNGEYRYEDRISCSLFNKNVQVLCEFLELCKNEK